MASVDVIEALMSLLRVPPWQFRSYLRWLLAGLAQSLIRRLELGLLLRVSSRSPNEFVQICRGRRQVMCSQGIAAREKDPRNLGF
jgi:hypothetical protein